mmetsp:Transcript_12071/g.11712  ORF Transcript_12071/g.11712 Transcript_12071/m.11712 type:complete len:526 (+) Transcript_12071:948-2525(+)
MTTEPIVPSSSTSTTEESAPKRKRRSGWDAPAVGGAPAVQANSTTSTAMVAPPAVNMNLAQNMMSRAPNPLLPNPFASTYLPPAVGYTPLPAPVGYTPGGGAPAPYNPNSGNYTPKLDCRIYVGSLHYNVTDADIRALFSPFGTISRVDMSLDAITGKTKGFCFVDYNEASSAIAALEMNLFVLAGRKIKVGRPSGVGNEPSSFVPTTGLGSSGSTFDPMMLNDIGAIYQAEIEAKEKAQAQAAALSAAASSSGGPGVGAEASSSSSSSETTNSSAEFLAAKALIVANQPKGLVFKNVRNEINAAEFQAVLSPFGDITFCNFLGLESVFTAEPPVSVRTVLVEFKTHASAVECQTGMKDFNLGGVNLLLEMVDVPKAKELKGDLKTVEVFRPVPLKDPKKEKKTGIKNEKNGKNEKTEKKNLDGNEKTEKIIKTEKKIDVEKNKNSVVLINLVSLEEAKEPTLKGEIAQEAELHGDLKDIEIVIDKKNEVRVVLTYYEAVSAQKSFKAMNGRFFGGNMVTAILNI